MTLAMPVVWSDSHRLHDSGGEVWIGLRTPGTEVPIGTAGKPTMLVQEGGYDLETIGALVHETLAGCEEGRRD
jgi:hypothetical protein